MSWFDNDDKATDTSSANRKWIGDNNRSKKQRKTKERGDTYGNGIEDLSKVNSTKKTKKKQ